MLNIKIPHDPPRYARVWLALAGAAALFASGCGANNLASKLRDENPNAADAMKDDHGGGDCMGVDAPLIVDADESMRGNLEDAMKHGIAVVSYDCKKIHLLTGCKAAGEYTYSGFTRKTSTMQLANADAIKANLPFSGASIAGKLEAEMSKGVTLDIATVLVGKKTSTTVVTADMIQGQASECKAATHFVRAAMIGAFAMQTGSKAAAKAEAEAFFAKGGASSSSSLNINKMEGELAECLKADPDDTKPRKNCAGLIRLELVVIGKHGPINEGAEPTLGGQAGDNKPLEVGADSHTCPRGLTWVGDHCDVATAAATHACKEGDVPDCTTQCDRGNADSCNTLGVYWAKGDWKAKPDPIKPDPAKAEKAFLFACEKGVASACSNVAGIYRWGQATSQPNGVQKDEEKFKKFAMQGCNGADGRGCYLLANSYFSSSKDEDRVKSGPLYLRSCNYGYAGACSDLGYKLNGSDRERFGKAFLTNQLPGIAFLSRACKNGALYSCTATGDAYAAGLGTDRDGPKALELYTVACDKNSPLGCVRAGHLYEYGVLNKDEKKAAELYKKACEMTGTDGKPAYGHEKGCLYLGRLYERGAGGLTADPIQAANLYRKSCDTDQSPRSNDGCADLARIYEQGKGVPKNPAKATELLAFGCKGYWGSMSGASCLALAPRYMSGNNLPKDEKKDEKKAVETYRKACGFAPEACLALATLASQGKGGLSKDDKTVASFYNSACGLSNNHDADIAFPARIAEGCSKLAAAEASGKGRDKDPAKAYEHFSRACARGDKAACGQAKKIGPPPAK